MADQGQPESSESGGGDEFDLHTEAMRSRSSASSFSRRRDRFRVARTALYCRRSAWTVPVNEFVSAVTQMRQRRRLSRIL